MGKFVDYRAAPRTPAAAGVSKAGITGAEGKHLHAEHVRLDAGATFQGSVPAGCDQHLFVLCGSGSVEGAGRAAQPIKFGSFVLVEEGKSFALKADVPTEVLSVLTPPPGTQNSAPGFKGGIKVVSMHNEHVDDFPEKKKQRIFLATKETCGSERAHGMIVKYVPETETTMHAHPDCESLFVFLEGDTAVTVDGEKKTGRFGSAAFFPCGNKHDLHGTPGNSYFIEFHVPYNYTTVR
jgi:mannose-6-phosphate isomerase-like protein (cupin superfamily)